MSTRSAPRATAVGEADRDTAVPDLGAVAQTPQRQGGRTRGWWWLLLLPNLVFLIIFFGYPIVDVLRQSATTFTPPQSGGIDNYAWFFETDANVRILVRTLTTAAVVTIGTVLLAYPYAYLLTVVRPATRRLLLAAALVPFWTSLMVRNFAWVVLLQPRGPLNSVLDALGMDRLSLLGTAAGVTIGEIQILLPFVILPLYARLRTIDRRLIDAAVSLGAPIWRAMLRIYLPLSVPGILSGALLSFVLSLGFYITPALLGGSQQQLLSPLIVSQVTQTLAMGRAGAMAAVLLLAAFLLIALAFMGSRGLVEGSSGSGVEQDGDERRAGRRPFLTVVVGLTALVMTLPSLVVIPMSFTAQKTFAFPPSGWSGRWWIQLFTDEVWLTALANSVLIALTTTALATILGTTAALGLVRSRLHGASVLGALFLVPLVVPLVVAAVGMYGVYLRWHLTGTFAGFVLAHTCLAVPYVIVPVIASLRGLDERLESAAASLGASPWSTFWTVTMPLIRPGLLAGALFAFVTSLDETVVSLFLVTPQMRTLPVTIFGHLTRDIDPTVAAASTVLFALTSVLVIALVLVQLRHDRKGALA